MDPVSRWSKLGLATRAPCQPKTVCAPSVVTSGELPASPSDFRAGRAALTTEPWGVGRRWEFALATGAKHPAAHRKIWPLIRQREGTSEPVFDSTMTTWVGRASQH
jgi:hypothetical protein